MSRSPFAIVHVALMLIPFSSNLTEAFKTPGKLRGKTPHTTRKAHAAEARVVGLILGSLVFAYELDSNIQHLASVRRVRIIAQRLEKHTSHPPQPFPCSPVTSNRGEDGTIRHQARLPSATCVFSPATASSPCYARLGLLWQPGSHCHGSK